MAAQDNSAADKFWTQYDAVHAAAAARGIDLEYHPIDARERSLIPDCVYEKGRLLVREHEVGAVRAHLVDSRPVTGRGGHGMVMLEIQRESAPDAIDRLERAVGRERVAAPNHLVSICPANLCPADEPVPAPHDAEPTPIAGPPAAGQGIRVRVIDTGLVPTYCIVPWLPDNTTTGDVNSILPGIQPGALDARKTYDVKGDIMEYAGHGTFIAGVLKRVAPATEVNVSDALPWAGATLEDDLCNALLSELDMNPHIISLSAGGTTYKSRPHLGLDAVRERLQQDGCTTLLVAAAGNEGSKEKFWPAAYAAELPDAVLSVGALRQDGKGQACFSNYGDWVRVFAPGERLVNAFAIGPYSYVDPPRLDCRYHDPSLYCPCTCMTAPPQYARVNFLGMAQWSGTSFATPIVAGMVAAHMSATGQFNARVAAQELLADAAQIADKDGTKIRVLVP